MKTAIAIDSLISRDESTFLLELVLNLFPDSEIYTIAHKRGGILGQVETCPIVSSFLTHKAKDISVFRKNYYLLPSAVKGMPIHPSIEKMIILSRGYIQGLNIPKKIEKYLYILEWDLVPDEQIGWQKIFKPYVNDWRDKTLRNFPKIAVSSEALKEKLHLPNAEVLEPTYRTEEYPFVKDEDHNFLFTHHLVYTHDLSDVELKTLLKFLEAKGETVRLLGPDSHLSDIKSAHKSADFAGDHCEATSALYSHQAKAIWDFSKTFFPLRAFGGLATGRPVVVREDKTNREYLVQGSHFLSDFSQTNLEKMYEEVNGSYLAVDRKALRRLGLKWNERLFKSRMVKFLDKNS
jgi:hypothetical protein